MSKTKPKVLIIGVSGAVGMATRDAITDYVGADVIGWDRRADTPEQQAARTERADRYKMLVEMNGILLDGEQEKWLLKDRQKLPEADRGSVHDTLDIKSAVQSGVDAIVITAGIPRKGNEDRSAVASKNAALFADLGKQLADIAAEKIAQDSNFHLPVIINAGNPMDTMTEVLGRELHENLAQHASQALAAGNKELASAFAAETRSLKGKIIGQGGILDGARAATAIHEITKIALNDIVSVPVLGTHNPNMVVDLDNTMVKHNGNIIPLRKYPGIDVDAIAAEISDHTKKGGTRIIQDYRSVLEVDQSAVLATGAAIMQMVDSVVNDKQLSMATAVYHTTANPRDKAWQGTGEVMGHIVKLGRAGATDIQPSTNNPALRADIIKAQQAARKDTREARGVV